MRKRSKVVLFWSTGKDSAWALYRLRKAGWPVELLLTTHRTDGTIPFHNVPVKLAQRQAEAAGLSLHLVSLPFPCPNALYEAVILETLQGLSQEGFGYVAFGDLYLVDIRAYRTALVRRSGLVPLFPAWIGRPVRSKILAHRLLRRGFHAIVCWAEPQFFPDFLPGRPYNRSWLRQLPPKVDPCGERGEFHTFCYQAPVFRHAVPFRDLWPAGMA
ncbi:MAG: ATP-binding protein [Bacteroidia bacterium]